MTLQAFLETIPPQCNKHDRVIVLIEACLDEGIDTRKGIVDALVKLGFNYRHVAILLNEGTGESPERHNWRRDENGRYSRIC